jgi:hypothetical protein
MSIKVRATRCGIAGTRGHWPGCWGPAIGLNVPREPRLILRSEIARYDGKALQPFRGKRVVAVGMEGHALTVHLA